MWDRQQSQRLFKVGFVAIAAILIYYGSTSKLTEPLHLYLGVIMLSLAALPALLWARSNNRGLPTFEVLLLTTGNATRYLF